MEMDQAVPVEKWNARGGESSTGGLSTLPMIDETGVLETATSTTPRDRIISLLDQVEVRVERLRKDVSRIEDEKDSLLSSLDAIKHSELLNEMDEYSRDDIKRYMDRISARAKTVEAIVRTDRDPQQEEALHQVNLYIDELVIGVRNDPMVTAIRCQSFMNACSSQQVMAGGTDKNFETVILGCTLDDQKRVKKRLQGLLDYFDKLNITPYI